MTRRWVTCGTPNLPGILNSLTAACDTGYIPDSVRILSNPPVSGSVSEASEHIETIIDAYGGTPEVEQHELAEETDFEAIAAYYRSEIETARAQNEEVAVDVTPGRKFMSAIAFQAGMRLEADHVFYFHRQAGPYPGSFYPEIPRTAANLIDFTEVI